jgi:hypothetical protein
MSVLDKIDTYLNEETVKLSDKELFVVGLILGFKPGHR